MKRKIIIIGCSISSLYASLKCLNMGYDVIILEKKSEKNLLKYDEEQYNNYQLYNSSHKLYINLLRTYGICGKYTKTNIKNIEFYNLLNKIILAIKIIPNNILYSCSCIQLLAKILCISDFKIINKIIENNIYISNLFHSINIIDFISIFSQDIYNKHYYYLDKSSIQLLFKKMINHFIKKGGNIIYENNVHTIQFFKGNFVINKSINSDLLFTTISKDSLLKFSFWKPNQLQMLNMVDGFKSNVFKEIILKMIKFDDNFFNTKQNNIIDNFLLDELHIVYPNTLINKNKIYIWKYGTNSMIMRENIKNMYNEKFIICSESFSKNNMFINNSLQYIDNAIYYILCKFK